MERDENAKKRGMEKENGRQIRMNGELTEDRECAEEKEDRKGGK